MITALAARWLLTVVFAAAGPAAAPSWRGRAGAADAAGRVPAVSCVVMCAALTAMTWWSEPAVAAWVQAAVFGCAALGFGLVSLAGSGRVRRPGLPAVLHTLMAGAMIWLLTAMPAVAGMRPALLAARWRPCPGPPRPPRYSPSASCSRCLARPSASRG